MTEDIHQKIELLNYCVNILKVQDTNSNISLEDANHILCDFQKDPESYLITENILNSDSDIMVKFTVLQNLESCAERRWNLVEQDIKENIINYLLELVFSPENEMPNQLINKIYDIFNEILIQDYNASQSSFFIRVRQTISQEEPRNPKHLEKYFNLIGSFMLFLSIKMGEENNSYLYRRFSYNHFNNLSKQFYNSDYDNVQEDITDALDPAGNDDEVINSALNCCCSIIKCNSFVSQKLYQNEFIEKVKESFMSRPKLAATSISIVNEIFAKIVLPDYANPLEFTSDVLEMLLSKCDTIQLSENSNCWPSFIDLLSKLLDLYGIYIINGDQFNIVFDVALGITEKANTDILIESCEALLYEYLIQANNQVTQEDFDTCFIPRIATILVDKMPAPLVIEPFIDLYNNEEKRVVKNEDFESMRKCISAIDVFFSQLVIDVINAKKPKLETIDDIEHFCWAVSTVSNKEALVPGKAYPFLEEIFRYLMYEINGITNERQGEYDETAERLGICFSVVVMYSFEFIGDNNELFANVFEALFDLLNFRWEKLLLFVINTLLFISIANTSIFSQPNESWENKTAIDILLDKLNETITLENYKDELKLFVHCLCRSINSIKDTEYGRRCIEALKQIIFKRVEFCMINFNKESIPTWKYFTNTLSIMNSYVETFSSQYIDIFRTINLGEFMNSFKDIYASSGDLLVRELCRNCRASIMLHLHKFISYLDDPKTTIMPVLERDFIYVIMTDYSQSDPDLCLPQTLTFLATLIARMDDELQDMINDIMDRVFEKTTVIIESDDQYKYPDLSEEFYSFLDRLINSMPKYVLSLEFDQLIKIYEILRFGCNSSLQEQSINCLQYIRNFANLMETAQSDNQEIYMAYKQSICVDLGKLGFKLLIDGLHKFAIEEIGKLVLLVFKSNNSEEFMNQFSSSLENDATPDLIDIVIGTVKQILNTNADEKNIEEILRDFIMKAVQETSDNEETVRERMKKNVESINELLKKSNKRQTSTVDEVIKNRELPKDSELNDLFNSLKDNLKF